MEQNSSDIISKPTPDVSDKKLTPEILWSFGRVGEVAVSPNGNQIIYGVKYYDISLNKGNTDLYSMNPDGSGLKQITRTQGSEHNIQWRPDGNKIGFLYNDGDNGTQLWEMNTDGTGRKMKSKLEGGVTGFKYSPDGSKIVFLKEVPDKKQVKDKHSDLPKAEAYVAEDLMFRHWDSWETTYNHLYIADNNELITEAKDILDGEPYHAPNRPFGGMEQVDWAADSKSLIYVSVKKIGKDYAVSTNSDLYHYNIEDGSTKNLTSENKGYDNNPVFSNKGKYLAWESMVEDGYEADKNRLFILNLETGAKKDYTINFDQNVHGLSWDTNDENIYFVSEWHARTQIYSLNIASGAIQDITTGNHNYLHVWPTSGKLIATKQNMHMPTEVFSVDPVSGKEEQISNVNSDLLGKLDMPTSEERWVKTTDGKDMLVWVVYPPNFDSNKKYPTLLYCQGGPQSAVSQFFSYRWNFSLMASNDYIIVAPNRRGLPGFGQEWNEQISGDWSGQNIQDYLSAIDELAKEPYVDENKLGAIGASYGGYSVFYLAGKHEGRFKAFIAHDGTFNLESMYLETDELFFVNKEMGGAYWETDNETAQRTYANSPHKFVKNWDTPIMIIHGERDYRITYNQGMQAFTAAKLMDLPAKYLHFPEENHWVLSPQNGILWQREFFEWLDKWLKE